MFAIIDEAVADFPGAPAVDEAAFRTALPLELPDHLDAVLSEDAVASHERPTLGHRVSDQQPVEGVTMMKWQALDGGGENPGDRQESIPLSDLFSHVRVHGVRKREVPEARLDGHLPDGRGAEVQPCIRGLHGRARRATQAAITGGKPEERMGVEQEIHR